MSALQAAGAVVDRPDSATHYRCPAAPDSETHHLRADTTTRDGSGSVNKDELFERDNRLCLACQSARALTEQHRLNRKQGGRHGAAHAEINLPSNRITLCWGCNHALESNPRSAAWGRRMGWKLTEGEDPREVAVYHSAFREWRQLHDDGTYTVVPGRDAPAMRWAA